MSVHKENLPNQNTIIENVKYTGLFLSNEQQQLLLERFPPIYEKVSCDHVTLKYKPKEGIPIQDIGKVKEIRIIRYVINRELGAQVLIIKLPDDLKKEFEDIIPHITISTKLNLPDIKDYSQVVEGLTSGEITEFKNPIELSVLSGYFNSLDNKPIVSLD